MSSQLSALHFSFNRAGGFGRILGFEDRTADYYEIRPFFSGFSWSHHPLLVVSAAVSGPDTGDDKHEIPAARLAYQIDLVR